MKVFFILSLLTLVTILARAIGTDDISAEETEITERGYYPYYKPAGLGEYCDLKKDCRRRFVCESHICKYKEGARCNKAPHLCAKGSICVGSRKKKCVIPGGTGASCGSSEFDICKSGLVCRDHKCAKPKIPLGGNCKPAGSVCEHGLVCAGTKRYKRCVRVRGPGEKCKLNNPFFICKDGLKCAGGICKTKENVSCLPKGSVCLHGLVCVGRTGKKTCVRPRSVGEECGTNPFRVCEKGLECVHYVCRKPKVPEGGSCKAPGSVCEHGLVCIHLHYGKVCFRPRGLGEKCRPYKKPCKEGLVCRGRRCRKPVVPVGGDCLPKGSECVKGSVCIGTPHKKICVKPSKLGDGCGTPFKFCKGRLLCLDHVCVKSRRKLGQRCGGKVRCKKGLDCKFLKFLGNGFCVKVVGRKKTCGQYLVCRKGLKCIKGKCRYYYW